MNNYIVATIKPWNIEAYETHTPGLSGQWHLITNKEDLTPALIEKLNPRYIFFPHWSWIVPKDILNAAECVCFHMTDVPYGRGGSPLQNLIARGHKETKLTALKMEQELDAGPVYLKKPLDLSGSAQGIFERLAPLIYECISEIVTNEPEPAPQEGEVVEFERRTPDMSELPKNASMDELYDHIRMLDAESYPKAFIEYGDFRIVFSGAEKTQDGKLSAQIEIASKQGNE